MVRGPRESVLKLQTGDGDYDGRLGHIRPIRDDFRTIRRGRLRILSERGTCLQRDKADRGKDFRWRNKLTRQDDPPGGIENVSKTERRRLIANKASTRELDAEESYALGGRRGVVLRGSGSPL